MAILLCEVPLNKDTERERERKRGNSSSRTIITGTYYTYEVTVALAVGPLAWATPAEVVCIVWRCSLSTCCCCCKTAVLWPLAFSIRKAVDQLNTSYFDFPKNKH